VLLRSVTFVSESFVTDELLEDLPEFAAEELTDLDPFVAELSDELIATLAVKQ
jgi:hypothetical protein